ncbi:hypothetical protein BSKO_12238 [Bryopsis sp. KO-2023]|nr:hypothetical protein BSKO_12238 [Bryopsis sp. KO-2023]
MPTRLFVARSLGGRSFGLSPHDRLGFFARRSWCRDQLNTRHVATGAKQQEDDTSTQKGKLRLDAYIAQRDEKASRSQVQNAIKSGHVCIDGKPVTKPSHSVKQGDNITYRLVERVPTQVCPEDIPLDTMYNDEDVLVINKPSGMVVHPSAGHWEGTLVNALMHRLKLKPWDLKSDQSNPISFSQWQNDHVSGLTNIGLESEDFIEREEEGKESSDSITPAAIFRPGIVHRLDIGTSGVMVVALNTFSLRHLSEQFKNRTVNRVYLALMVGCPDPGKGRVSTNIGRNPSDRKTMTCFGYNSTKGKPATSNYQVVESLLGGKVSLVAWKLESGRTHQIRVHAKHIGHPIFGDESYGRSNSRALEKWEGSNEQWDAICDLAASLGHPALHAASLDFEHPTKNQRLKFESNLPQDFARSLVTFRSLANI